MDLDLEEVDVDAELKIDKYFLSEALSDVTLVSGKEEFPAHRFVLSSLM